jgi:hypothetical protein
MLCHVADEDERAPLTIEGERHGGAEGEALDAFGPCGEGRGLVERDKGADALGVRGLFDDRHRRASVGVPARSGFRGHHVSSYQPRVPAAPLNGPRRFAVIQPP